MHRTQGFSLITISIILVASAIVLASLMPGGDAGDYNQLTANNTAKLDKIEEATRSFMLTQGRRPCPADGQYGINDPFFGVEPPNPGTCVGDAPAAPFGPDTGTGYVVAGTIPTKTLGLPDDYAFDAWGRRFTYLVDTRATDIAPCVTMERTPATGAVTIETSTGGTVLDNTMYAYVSHGPSGHGAFPAQGSSVAGRINIGSIDTDKLTNASVNSSFATNFTNVRVKKDPTSTFDDLVYYRGDLKNTCCIGPLCTILKPGFRADGVAANDNSGWSVAVGDINGDGIPDLIIGANGTNTGAGSTYVIFGTKLGFPNPLPLSSLTGTKGFVINGVTAGDNSGYSVAVGDINGDGIPDLIIGAIGTNSGAGSTYVIFGGPGPKTGANTWAADWTANSGVFSLSTLNGTNGFRVDGARAGDQLGFFVATGDINGDGKADLIIVSPGSNVGTNNYAHGGSTYVLFGGPGPKTGTNTWAADWTANSGVFSLSTLNGTNGFRMDGVAQTVSGMFGMWSAVAGDVNGDGNADLIIGAAGASPGTPARTGAGSTYVVFGGPGPKTGSNPNTWATDWTANSGVFSLSTLNGTNGFRVDGVTAGDQLGFSVATGDINGDGKADLVIGAPGANSSAGSTYVIFGGPGPKTGANTWATDWTANSGVFSLSTLNGTNGFRVDGADDSGFSLAVGDMNGDGIADLLINTPASNTGIYVLFGGKTRKDGTAWQPSQTLNTGSGNLINGTNGFQLSGVYTGKWNDLAVGDINGDGRNDIIFGSYGLSPVGRNSAGSTYIYFGHGGSYPATYNLNNVCTGGGC